MYKIMLADDEGIVIDSLKFIIEKEFKDTCEVQYAKTGRSVIELAESFRPDVAVMDIQMPEMDGYEATAAIRELSSDIPIVAVTAFAYPEDMRRILSSGFNGCLPKPVSAESLKKKISELCPGK